MSQEHKMSFKENIRVITNLFRRIINIFKGIGNSGTKIVYVVMCFIMVSIMFPITLSIVANPSQINAQTTATASQTSSAVITIFEILFPMTIIIAVIFGFMKVINGGFDYDEPRVLGSRKYDTSEQRGFENELIDMDKYFRNGV